MALNYYEETQDKHRVRLEHLLRELPPAATDFFTDMNDRCAPSTCARYAEDLLAFCSYVCGTEDFPATPRNLTLSDFDHITARQISEYLKYLDMFEEDGKIKHLHASAKKRRLAALRSFYRHFFARGDLKNNPAQLVYSPKISKKDISALDREEQGALVDNLITGVALTDKQKETRRTMMLRDKALVYVLLGTGIRVSELAGLDLTDVDLEKCRLNVIRKGGKSDHVYFNNEVCEALRDYIANERMLFRPDSSSENALWLSQKHSRLSTRNINLILKIYAEKLGIKETVSPHLFRRTFATQALINGAELSAISKTLGHEAVSTTARFYTQFTEDAKKAVAQSCHIEQ